MDPTLTAETCSLLASVRATLKELAEEGVEQFDRAGDDANDAGFEFEVLEKIEKVRHGTIEAGTGKPLGESASHHGRPPEWPGPSQDERVMLAHAFATLDAIEPDALDPEWAVK